MGTTNLWRCVANKLNDTNALLLTRSETEEAEEEHEIPRKEKRGIAKRLFAPSPVAGMCS